MFFSMPTAWSAGVRRHMCRLAHPRAPSPASIGRSAHRGLRGTPHRLVIMYLRRAVAACGVLALVAGTLLVPAPFIDVVTPDALCLGLAVLLALWPRTRAAP